MAEHTVEKPECLKITSLSLWYGWSNPWEKTWYHKVVLEFRVSPLIPDPAFWAVGWTTAWVVQGFLVYLLAFVFFCFLFFFFISFFCFCSLSLLLLNSLLGTDVLLVEPDAHFHPISLLLFCQIYFPLQTGGGSSGHSQAEVDVRNWEQETDLLPARRKVCRKLSSH